MSKFAEYIESWKKQDRILHKRLSLLQENIWRLLPEVSRELKCLGAKEVIVFGSLIEGDFKQGSDIDIAVERLPENRYIEAIVEVEKILAPIHVNFDLVLYERSHPWIKKRIEKGKKL